MRNDSYTNDFVGWTEDQAKVLRGLADAPGLDNERLAEEIEDLGRSDLLKINSLLRQALAHIIKIAVDGEAAAAPHWRQEAMTFMLDASDAWSPGYRQRIDLDVVWRKAVKQAEFALQEFDVSLPELPASCPVSLDILLGDDVSVERARDAVLAALEPDTGRRPA